MQLIYVDHRGNGRSERGDPRFWTLRQWAADIRALCLALHIERPIVLGVSFGGYVALQYCLDYPNHISKLILSSSTAKLRIDRAVKEFARIGGDEAGEVAAQFWADPSWETLPEYNKVCGPHYNQKPGDPDRLDRVQKNPEVLFRFFHPVHGEGRVDYDLYSRLREVRAPTLIMVGEDDPITPLQDSVDMADAMSSGVVRLEIFPGCGHVVDRDDPKRAFALLREFISS